MAPRLTPPTPALPTRGRGILVALLIALLLSFTAQAAEPVVPKAKGGACVEDTQVMRRNHMDLLKHQRDATLRQGVRGTGHSLKDCVACHETEGQPINAEGQFCQSCHSYAAVSVDCFSCHATQSARRDGQ